VTHSSQGKARFADRPLDSIFAWPRITREEANEPVTVTLPLGEWRNLLMVTGGEYGSDPVHLGRKAVVEVAEAAGFRAPSKPHRHRWVLVPPGDDYCEGCGEYR
jgi:hypothetical protein